MNNEQEPLTIVCPHCSEPVDPVECPACGGEFELFAVVVQRVLPSGGTGSTEVGILAKPARPRCETDDSA